MKDAIIDFFVVLFASIAVLIFAIAFFIFLVVMFLLISLLSVIWMPVMLLMAWFDLRNDKPPTRGLDDD